MSKRILLFGASSFGLVNFRLELMKTLKKLDYEVIACAPIDNKSKKVEGILGELEIELISLKLRKSRVDLLRDCVAMWRLYRVVVNKQPRIILSYNIKPVIYGSMVAKFAGIERIYSIITGVGTIFISNNIVIKLIRCLIKILYKVSLKFNHVVFFQNPDDLDLFISEKIVNRNKTILLNGSGVDLDYYASDCLPQKPVFLLAARLIRDKGIYEYISACKILKIRYPQIMFYLVGGLDSNPTSLSEWELKGFVHEGVINYIGNVDDVKPIFNEASVFVLPSYREGTPRAVLEAMAMSRPIITTDVPGCRETVIDGVNGYLVPAKNVNVLVNAMEKFILYPKIIADMGRESRRIAVEKYDVHKVNTCILEAMGLL